MLKFDVYASPTTCLLELNGMLTYETKVLFIKQVEKYAVLGRKEFVMDMRKVSLVDSSGLSALVKAHNLCKQENIYLVFLEVPPQIKQLLNTMGIGKVLTLINQLQFDQKYTRDSFKKNVD